MEKRVLSSREIQYLEKRPIFSEVKYRRIAGEKMVFLEDYLEGFSRGLSREKNGWEYIAWCVVVSIPAENLSWEQVGQYILIYNVAVEHCPHSHTTHRFPTFPHSFPRIKNFEVWKLAMEILKRNDMSRRSCNWRSHILNKFRKKIEFSKLSVNADFTYGIFLTKLLCVCILYFPSIQGKKFETTKKNLL